MLPLSGDIEFVQHGFYPVYVLITQYFACAVHQVRQVALQYLAFNGKDVRGMHGELAQTETQ